MYLCINHQSIHSSICHLSIYLSIYPSIYISIWLARLLISRISGLGLGLAWDRAGFHIQPQSGPAPGPRQIQPLSWSKARLFPNYKHENEPKGDQHGQYKLDLFELVALPSIYNFGPLPRLSPSGRRLTLEMFGAAISSTTRPQ